MKRKPTKREIKGTAGIRITPDSSTLQTLNELADLDDRPLKLYVERILAQYVKERNGITLTNTNY